MEPELGPPLLEEIAYPDEDVSWTAEWEHFAGAVAALDGRPLLGDLSSARYAWAQVEAAYASGGAYAPMRLIATGMAANGTGTNGVGRDAGASGLGNGTGASGTGVSASMEATSETPARER